MNILTSNRVMVVLLLAAALVAGCSHASDEAAAPPAANPSASVAHVSAVAADDTPATSKSKSSADHFARNEASVAAAQAARGPQGPAGAKIGVPACADLLTVLQECAASATGAEKFGLMAESRNMMRGWRQAQRAGHSMADLDAMCKQDREKARNEFKADNCSGL